MARQSLRHQRRLDLGRTAIYARMVDVLLVRLRAIQGPMVFWLVGRFHGVKSCPSVQLVGQSYHLGIAISMVALLIGLPSWRPHWSWRSESRARVADYSTSSGKSDKPERFPLTGGRREKPTRPRTRASHLILSVCIVRPVVFDHRNRRRHE